MNDLKTVKLSHQFGLVRSSVTDVQQDLRAQLADSDADSECDPYWNPTTGAFDPKSIRIKVSKVVDQSPENFVDSREVPGKDDDRGREEADVGSEHFGSIIFLNQ